MRNVRCVRCVWCACETYAARANVALVAPRVAVEFGHNSNRRRHTVAGGGGGVGSGACRWRGTWCGDLLRPIAANLTVGQLAKTLLGVGKLRVWQVVCAFVRLFALATATATATVVERARVWWAAEVIIRLALCAATHLTSATRRSYARRHVARPIERSQQD